MIQAVFSSPWQIQDHLQPQLSFNPNVDHALMQLVIKSFYCHEWEAPFQYNNCMIPSCWMEEWIQILVGCYHQGDRGSPSGIWHQLEWQEASTRFPEVECCICYQAWPSEIKTHISRPPDVHSKNCPNKFHLSLYRDSTRSFYARSPQWSASESQLHAECISDSTLCQNDTQSLRD